MQISGEFGEGWRSTPVGSVPVRLWEGPAPPETDGWRPPSCPPSLLPPALPARSSRLWGNLPVCPGLSECRGLDQPTRGIPWCQDCQVLHLLLHSEESAASRCFLQLLPSLCGSLTPRPPTPAQKQKLSNQGSSRRARGGTCVTNRALEPHLLPWEHSPSWASRPGTAVASLLLQAASYLRYFTSECIL